MREYAANVQVATGTEGRALLKEEKLRKFPVKTYLEAYPEENTYSRAWIFVDLQAY